MNLSHKNKSDAPIIADERFALQLVIVVIGCLSFPTINHAEPHQPHYPWLTVDNPNATTLQNRFPPPTGFIREKTPPGSFAEWLRQLPLKPKDTPVMLFNGARKPNQSAHAAVIDIDTGNRDLQQCADAVMRLRAEYLYAQNRFNDIKFNFTDGTPVAFSRWSRGDRPRMSTRTTSWRSGGRKSTDRQSFKRYMTAIFSYAGTYSLSKELKPVALEKIQAGDVFIKGGFPGHAIIVADMVVNPDSGEKKFLLIQSYMPAQDMHILRNPAASWRTGNSPWYALPETPGNSQLVTPEWAFAWSALKRFHE